MKNYLSILIAILMPLGVICQGKVDIEKEKAAIIALIEEETASYYASDFDRWAATQVQDGTNISTDSWNSGFSYITGWDSVSNGIKPYIVEKKETQKEVKSNYKIKVYNGSAWVIFNNETFSKTGESTGKFIATVFLEKKDNKWKSVYRNKIEVSSYYSPTGAKGFPDIPVADRYMMMVGQTNSFILNSINYAKSMGKTVEDIANFTGDQFKTSWNKADGYNGFVNGVKYSWVSFIPNGELKILEQDDNHFKFSVKDIFPYLKNNSPQLNVTYNEYLTFIKIVDERIAEYMGAEYIQKVDNGEIVVTITKK
jgi:hypothetical protein